MTAALRRVSVQRGIDPREYTLVAFGGAGPLHAGLLLREMGFRAVLVPRFPGLFAASGLTSTDIRVDDSRTVLGVLRPELFADLAAWYTAARQDADRAAAPGRRTRLARIRLAASADCRFLGQGYELNVPLPAPGRRGVAALGDRFRELHLRTYGHANPEQEVEVVTRSAVGVRRAAARLRRIRRRVAPGSRSARPAGSTGTGLGTGRTGERTAARCRRSPPAAGLPP